MRVLVCVKRVPLTGGKIVLTEDAQAIETKHLGFTISPHEECGVEEAVRLIEATGGESVVLTLGPAQAEEQLRDAMALGADRAIHLVTDGAEWDPQATAAAIVGAIREDEEGHGHFDLGAYDAYLTGKLEDFELPEAEIARALLAIEPLPKPAGVAV